MQLADQSDPGPSSLTRLGLRNVGESTTASDACDFARSVSDNVAPAVGREHRLGLWHSSTNCALPAQISALKRNGPRSESRLVPRHRNCDVRMM